jgi:hypothetical protein
MSMRDNRARSGGVASDFSRTEPIIDAAARELTRGEPSPHLRHQIRARIEMPRRRPVPVWAPAFAGVAALVIVVVVFQQAGTPIALPVPQPAAVANATLMVVAPLEPERSEPPERSERSVRTIEIEPLVIEPIAMPLMAVTTSSGDMPIEIEDLQIEPLLPQ